MTTRTRRRRLCRLILRAFRPEPRDYFYCERNGKDDLA